MGIFACIVEALLKDLGSPARTSRPLFPTMDPLSVSASIAALLAMSLTIVEALKKSKVLYRASETLRALINEISGLRLLLKDLRSLVFKQHVESFVKPPDCFLDSLGRLKTSTKQLEHFVVKRLTKKSEVASPKPIRWSFLRLESNMKEFKQSIREDRASLDSSVNVYLV